MKYTEQANEVIKIARSTARKLKHPYVGTEHLLLGLREVYTGVAGQVLGMNGVNEESIRKVVDELVSPLGTVEVAHQPETSPRLEYILEESKTEALHFRSDRIGTEHMLLALLRDADCVATRILLTLNINVQKLYQDIFAVLGGDPKDYQEEILQGGGRRREGGVLEQYGTDLTAQAEEGRLDPVIGREAEINRLIQVLSRRTKNNPCLVGEPGVGKTAVIEGLAAQIAAGIVPDGMKDTYVQQGELSPWMGLYSQSKHPKEAAEYLMALYSEEFGYQSGCVEDGTFVSVIPVINEKYMTNEIMKQYYTIANETTKIVPTATTRDEKAYDFYAEVKDVQPSLGAIVQGVMAQSIADYKNELKKLADASTEEWKRASEAVGMDYGVFEFSNWDPKKDYTDEDYKALK